MESAEVAPTGGTGPRLALLVACCVLLAAAGALMAVMESFLVPQRVLGGLEGISVLLALLGNAVVSGAGGAGTRSYWAACMPTLGWFVAVGLATYYRPGGDVIFPASLAGEPGVATVADAFLVAGVFGGALGLVAAARYTERPNAPTREG